jgi:hypothetical protein
MSRADRAAVVVGTLIVLYVLIWKAFVIHALLTA